MKGEVELIIREVALSPISERRAEKRKSEVSRGGGEKGEMFALSPASSSLSNCLVCSVTFSNSGNSLRASRRRESSSSSKGVSSPTFVPPGTGAQRLQQAPPTTRMKRVIQRTFVTLSHRSPIINSKIVRLLQIKSDTVTSEVMAWRLDIRTRRNISYDVLRTKRVL